jgi:serine/threonine protein kinase
MKELIENAKDLLHKLLHKKPSKRLTDPALIKKHPFFKEIDWTLLSEKKLRPPYIPK